jgi:plasmid stability protein
MAEILVTELEEWVLTRLEERSRRSGRSVEDETLEILREALEKEEAPGIGDSEV